MIPKIIHYCWLSSDPIPEHLGKCMESWHRHMPDYKLIKWDFSKFPPDKSLWVSQAFGSKKYAFAADYIRLYALYNYGGIYLDMDVEAVKPFDPLLQLKSFICRQKDISGLEVAAFGAEKGSGWMKDCLGYYNGRSFIKGDGSLDMIPLPDIVETTLAAKSYRLKDVHSIAEASGFFPENVLPVFPCDFFSPKSYKTGKIRVTPDTYAIHHFAGSWLDRKSVYIHETSVKLGFIPPPFDRYLAYIIGTVKYDGFLSAMKTCIKRLKVKFISSFGKQ